jgi:hypothetical protein
MAHTTNGPIRKLKPALQPSPSRPGMVPDSDHANKPSLSESATNGQEASPGDRVMGLGDFGKPTGEFGTVERANDDDAVVKWDDDGRERVTQPSVKKI